MERTFAEFAERKSKDGEPMLPLKQLDPCFRRLGLMPKPTEIAEITKEIVKEKEKEKEKDRKKEVPMSTIDKERFKQLMAKKMVKD